LRQFGSGNWIAGCISGVQRITGTYFAVALTIVAQRVQCGAATKIQGPLPFDAMIGTTQAERLRPVPGSEEFALTDRREGKVVGA
jgi:hypothetical protein